MKRSIIIAEANNKGGVGKTTTVANLGHILASKGYRTLMIDMDGQCSLTENFISYYPERTVYQLMTEARTKCGLAGIIITGDQFDHPAENLDLIPSSPWACELDMMLTGKTQNESILVKALRTLNVEYNYDVVLMDCPPSLELMTRNALVACDKLLVPTTAEVMPLRGLKNLEEKCEEIAEELNPGLAIGGIIITRYVKGKRLSQSVEEALRSHYGDVVFQTRIRENVRLAECPQHRQDIISYDPASNGAADYQALTKEFIEKYLNHDEK